MSAVRNGVFALGFIDTLVKCIYIYIYIYVIYIYNIYIDVCM
jgi:hypothetical protein